MKNQFIENEILKKNKKKFFLTEFARWFAWGGLLPKSNEGAQRRFQKAL